LWLQSAFLVACSLLGATPSILFGQVCAERRDIRLFLAIDISSSMAGSKLVAARSFALDVIDGLNATGFLERGASIQFCADIIASNPWMSPASLRTNLAGLTITCAHPDLAVLDGTSLYDAILFGASSLRTTPSSDLRLFVVLTDGEDTSSSASEGHAGLALSGGDMVSRLIRIGSASNSLTNIAAVARSGGSNSFALNATTGALGGLVDDVVDASCVNFRPDAEISMSDSNLRLGTEGFQITFSGSSSDDVETSNSGLSFAWTFTRPDGTTFNRSGMSQTVTFDDSQLPGEDWSVRLQVTDPQGASDTRTRSFDVRGSPPNISTVGEGAVPVFGPIALSASPGTDIDGGSLSFVWEVIEAPPGGTFPVTHTWNTRVVPPFNTTEADITSFSDGADIGSIWRFEVTATDDEGEQDSEIVTVRVLNDPPELDVAIPDEVNEGDLIQAQTSVLSDDDGGALSFSWDIVQVPQSASVGLQTGFSTADFLTVSSTTGDAGTWIFEVTATDDEGEAVSERYSVLVDGLPITDVTGPATIGSLSFPLELDGTGSEDPDTRCGEPDYCHITGGDPVEDVSPGIIQWTWSLIDVPFELWDGYPLGSVTEVFAVPGHEPTLTLEVGDLEPGDWTFQLAITDAEGNIDFATFETTVINENGPPFALLSAPAQHVVDGISATVLTDVATSGAASFDPDNVLLGETLGPGLGITDYSWSITEAPVGCVAPDLPTLPSGPAQTNAILFPAGTVVPPSCQGSYRVQLTVTDDDGTPRQGTATATVIVGNCFGDLCVDYPTTLYPEFVIFSEDTDVLIYYHLNSLLYDDPVFASGMFTQLRIFHEDDLSTPVFTAYDPNVLASDKGSFLVFHWDGYDDARRRPISGRYTIEINLLDFAFSATAFQAVEFDAVWIEVDDVEIAGTSDVYVDFDGLDNGSDGITVDYAIVGQILPDQLTARFYDASSSLLHEEDVVGAFSGTFEWGGQFGGSTVPPGSYSAEIEAYRGGSSLGVSEQHDFTVYRMGLRATGGAVFDTPPGLNVFVNNDDDDFSGASDAAESAPGEDDLIEVEVVLEPALEGTLTFSTSAGSYRLWDTSAKGAETALPATLLLPADPLPPRFYLEATAAAVSDLGMAFQTVDGFSLTPATMVLNLVDLQVVNDTNNDHVIGPGDTQTYFANVARWDNAYNAAGPDGLPGTADDFSVVNGPDPSSFVEQDPSRFYIRVRDNAANTSATTLDQVTVSLETASAIGIPDDDLTSITLFETAPNSGEFVSRSQILTSPDIQVADDANADDEFSAHDGVAAVVSDDGLDDRTHRATIDGAFLIEYQPTGASAPKAAVLPICQRGPTDARRRLQLNVTVFNEPFLDHGLDHAPGTADAGEGDGAFTFTDTNGDGQHSAGEPSEQFVDLSSGLVATGTVGTWGGVVPLAQVNAQIQRANVAWAQACIELELLAIRSVAAPQVGGVDVLADGTFNIGTEEAALMVAYAPAATIDVLEVFFLAPIAGANAVSRTPSDMIVALGEKTFVYMAPNVNISFRTLAHEIGHVLDNGWDAPNAQTEFYPAGTTFLDNLINQYRRLSAATIANARTLRPAGNLAATGNRLLKPY
jgi:hypothetical protein